jgi:peptidoglycan hydrolase-like protein with peptidoglycan-binding domain
MVRLGYLSSEKMATGPGIYGPATTAAVKAFQDASGISGSGGYGPLTRAALTKAIAAKEPRAVAPAPPIVRGDKGPNVNQLKVALYRLGYVSKAMLDAHPDEFGSGTEAALKKFQKDHGLNVSGKYGTGTEANLKQALKKLPAAGAAAAAAAPSTSTGGAASAAKIDNVVKGTGLAGQGANIAKYAKQYGVPAELALAMFWHEAQFNSTGLAPQNNNPGNLRFVGQPGAVSGVSGFAKWPTVGEGVEAYFQLMSTVYRGFIDQKDWAGLVHEYAPATDGNDEAQYVLRIVDGMSAYRSKIY